MFVVDLDRTLIRTDLLHESLLNGLATRPLDTLAAFAGFGTGPAAGDRAALKARLAAMAPDVALLPLNAAVLEAVGAARARGERTALVSASEAGLVRAVADRVGVFDEAHGSEPGRNLKGEAKAAFLRARFGAEGFSYAGDAAADIPVWRAAAESGGEVLTVGAGPALRRAAEGVAGAGGIRHIEPRDGAFGGLLAGGLTGSGHLKAIRPHQWMKNLLVFLPLLAAHTLAPGAWGAGLAAFLAFSLVASSVYVVNDLLDLSADRAHPRKCFRPFASGRVPVTHGMVMAPALLLAGSAAGAFGAAPLFLLVLAGYYAATLAYSLVLKRRLIIDICMLAGLYTLRVIAGAAAAAVPLSPWMLAFSGFLFLSLAAMKRQAELVDGVRTGREKAAGRAYRTEDLPIVTMMALASGYIAVLVLALYVSSPEVKALYAAPWILWGACPVLLYWVSRLVMISHRGRMTDDPLVFAVRDRMSLASGGALLALALAAGPL